MRTPLAALLESLDLATLDDDRYEGRCVERARPRLFGGELLAQSLIAANRIAGDRHCHALHAHFLAPGDPAHAVEYSVRRVRDGRRFAQREVIGRQRGRDILLAIVSFTVEPSGDGSHQHAVMPVVAGPESLPSEAEHRRAVAGRM